MTPHLLQTPAWALLKQEFGWRPSRVQYQQASAQILCRRLPLGLSVAYIPKGPMIDWTDETARQGLLTVIHQQAKRQWAVFLKIEPDVWADDAEQAQSATTFLQSAGFQLAKTIQPRRTMMMNIADNEDAILQGMKQKTRYNIRLAGRKGVTVRHGTADDLPIFHQLSQITAERDGFGVHTLAYYQRAFELFGPDRCALFIAEYEQTSLAALLAFHNEQTAYYFYGASSNEYRKLMPNYLLQWEAIRWAKSQGCTAYDLWGLPDADLDMLEAEFQSRHDGLWGVYRFKRGFGGQVVRSVGAFDYVYNPLLYRLYQWRMG